MNSRELAANIKQSLVMRQVVEFYGFTPDRAGFIRCPFHAGDNQGSLKVYEGQGGFCCFGCGAKGSVIDFVMQLHDCNFIAACETLNRDFGLALPLGRNSTYREKKQRRDRIVALREQENARKRTELELDKKYWAAFDLWCVADLIVTRYSPEMMGGRILDSYANAVRELPQLADNLTQAEIERWKFEHATSDPGMGEEQLPDNRTI